MQLIQFRTSVDALRVGLLESDQVLAFPVGRLLADYLYTSDPVAEVNQALVKAQPMPLADISILSPVNQQEVWAAGVTYKRSKVAREEESAGAAQFYDKVYTAPRPELFLKATPRRVTPHGGPIRVRQDATWNVPEPELTLVISPAGKIVGYTIGNDVSSRDIEGENPLYLPQAKIYTGSCAIGPAITLASAVPNIQQAEIQLTIERSGQAAFVGQTSITQMARQLEELVNWLCRENDFPDGVLLMTGTGIVPADDFTLASGDIVKISITGLGTLVNPVA